MKKILLICDLGMSTSLIVKKMQDVAKLKNLDLIVDAKGFQSLRDFIKDYDCILLGPQIKYKLAEVQKIANEYNIKAECINMIDYGMGNGEKILEQALSLIN